MSQQAPVVFPTLPAGYCWPASPQTFLDNLQPGSYADVPDNVTGVTFGSVDPGPAGYSKPWYNTTHHRLYEFVTPNPGKWVALYPWPNNPGIKMLWEDTEANLDLLDNPGGQHLPTPGAELYTGAFWVIDHAYDGRSPMGVGNIPGTTPAKTIGLSANSGEGDHLMLGTELVQHTHICEFSDATPGGTYAHQDTGDAFPPDGVITDPLGLGPGLRNATLVASASLVAAVPGNITHPVHGLYIVKRTARLYYTL